MLGAATRAQSVASLTGGQCKVDKKPILRTVTSVVAAMLTRNSKYAVLSPRS